MYDAVVPREELLNVRETAALLGVHENTVRNWARAGLLRSARVPGARFHRFYRADVERLGMERGAPVVPAAHAARRTVGPELVDAQQLIAWAATMDARHTFPELVRRLLISTPGISDVRVRSGEGVSVAGPDGTAMSAGTPLLPPGRLVIEIGVGAEVRQKANADYEARATSASPGDVFVFVTARRWPGAAEWEQERRRERRFKNVRVLDVDDIVTWLVQSPLTHYWISEHLDLRPGDATTLRAWWERFSASTRPVLPAAFFLAGRDAQVAEFMEHLQREVVVGVRGASRDDATAFVFAALQAADAVSMIDAAVVVRSPEAWDRLTAAEQAMIFLPLFEGPRLASAREGSQVVVPAAINEPVRPTTITLPRLRPDAAAEALRQTGVDYDNAATLAAHARRSLPAMLRRISGDPRVNRPWWAEPPAVSVFAPALLCDGWTGAAGDIEVVERLTGQPWDQIEPVLLQSAQSPDPAMLRSGRTWMFASIEEAYLTLSPSISPRHIARWHELIVATLCRQDSARMSTDGSSGVSGMLRRGLARGVAILGNNAADQLADGVSARDHARRAVRDVLSAASQDCTGGTWRTLSDVLPLLAEGAPDEFLDAVEDNLREPHPLLLAMFSESQTPFGGSAHTGLLWALERLAWSREHFDRATQALAELAAIDPGGRLANRPSASLASIFTGWVRHTGASLDQRIDRLRRISSRHPRVGWDLLLRVWPSHHATAFPPASPEFRDWKPSGRTVSVGEWTGYVDALVGIALERVSDDPTLWADVLKRLGPLPLQPRQRLLDALRDAAQVGDWTTPQRIAVWERLRKEAARHRRFCDAEWALAADAIAVLEEVARRIEPSDNVERLAYLFDWHPDLPDVDPRDHSRHREVLATLRTEALGEALSRGLDAVRDLALRAAAPRVVGHTLADARGDAVAAEMCRWLNDNHEHVREAAYGWASRWLGVDSGARLRHLLAQVEAQDEGVRSGLALAAPAIAEVWDVLADDRMLWNAYWRRVPANAIYPDHVTRAAESLVAHNRAWSAVEALAFALQDDDVAESVTPDVVMSSLEKAIGEGREQDGSALLGYELGILLDYLEGHDADKRVLARLEFATVLLVQNYRAPRALFSILADDPSLFVELVSRVYRGRNEPSRSLSEREAELSRIAWHVLTEWDALPGANADGVDHERLMTWVRAARLAFADADRADIGDEQIGQMLAASPDGRDGMWPAEAVREVIDTIGSSGIETGLFVGVFNRRGVTMRGPLDGGTLERMEAARYRECAHRMAGWPRTSRVLRQLAEQFERDAIREDATAELRGDLG